MSTWEMVSAISSAVSTFTVTGALIYAARQLRETRHSRAITTLLAVHKECQAPQLTAIRRRLRNGEFSDISTVSGADRDVISDLLKQMELVGFLVQRRLVDLDDAISLFPQMPLTYSQALPHIEDRRLTNPGYASKTESLIRRYNTVAAEKVETSLKPAITDSIPEQWTSSTNSLAYDLTSQNSREAEPVALQQPTRKEPDL
ncbi:hypothetical protein [Nonomuraea turcica]|uniref:hypothetical protein n=1 Tax=Nonomuraea sp. G32 TaxID=3067274 RepID=UPI00273B8861|nr:hypothetical protein [Nonomuraea sp. G32]MDP4506178.1 hypothetical protein [Nonomuraea sp. G32]